MRIRRCIYDLRLRIGKWSRAYGWSPGRGSSRLSFENKSYAAISAVYVVTGRPGAVQIWSTANPRMKLGNLKDISKEPLRVVFALPTTMDSLRVEAEACRTLEKFRDGNWFCVSEADAIEAIEAAAESQRRRSSTLSGASHYVRKVFRIFAMAPLAARCRSLLISDK